MTFRVTCVLDTSIRVISTATLLEAQHIVIQLQADGCERVCIADEFGNELWSEDATGTAPIGPV